MSHKVVLGIAGGNPLALALGNVNIAVLGELGDGVYSPEFVVKTGVGRDEIVKNFGSEEITAVAGEIAGRVAGDTGHLCRRYPLHGGYRADWRSRQGKAGF